MQTAHRFMPKGEEAMWKVVYDLVKGHEIGTEFTYSQLKTITGMDFRDNAVRQLIYQANKPLLEDCQRHFQNVRNIGYRIALPKEQMEHGIRRKKRARNQTRWGIRELTNLEFEKLSPDEKVRRIHALNHLLDSTKILNKRNSAALKAQREAIKHQEGVEEEIQKIRAQLDALSSSLVTRG